MQVGQISLHIWWTLFQSKLSFSKYEPSTNCLIKYQYLIRPINFQQFSKNLHYRMSEFYANFWISSYFFNIFSTCALVEKQTGFQQCDCSSLFLFNKMSRLSILSVISVYHVNKIYKTHFKLQSTQTQNCFQQHSNVARAMHKPNDIRANSNHV